MQYLLDTHILIWFLTGNERLSEKTKTIIKNIDNNCYISLASIWEIALKVKAGKLDLNISFDKLKSLLINNQIELLPVGFEHIQQLLSLPQHHNDPFDRIIIAQAIVEELTIISDDKMFKQYTEIALF
jgi:PIN domain nuclease of toxin-antitoxin system